MALEDFCFHNFGTKQGTRVSRGENHETMDLVSSEDALLVCKEKLLPYSFFSYVKLSTVKYHLFLILFLSI